MVYYWGIFSLLCSLPGIVDTVSVTIQHVTYIPRTGLMLPAVTLYWQKKTHQVDSKDKKSCVFENPHLPESAQITKNLNYNTILNLNMYN